MISFSAYLVQTACGLFGYSSDYLQNNSKFFGKTLYTRRTSIALNGLYDLLLLMYPSYDYFGVVWFCLRLKTSDN